jgi:pimeloyl-ACP methyl ester carboxylesterase
MTSVSGYMNTRTNGQTPRVWTVDRSGARLTCSAAGNRPAVLIIQGIGMSGVGWHPQMSELAHLLDVVAFTGRGRDGRSVGEKTLGVAAMARDALAVMDARGVDRFHLVGTSTGGLIAI